MRRGLFIVACIFLSSISLANVDVTHACAELKEQNEALVPQISTSLSEANLAGQCKGYRNDTGINLYEACDEFVEQKTALLSVLSTTVSEANDAGYCVGAVYRIAQRCGVQRIDYFKVANFIKDARPNSHTSAIKKQLGCARRG